MERQKDDEQDGDAADVMILQRRKRPMSRAMKKKMLDREVAFHENPLQDRDLYRDAEKKEWASWCKTGCIKVTTPEQASVVRREVNRSRIIRLRFVYRDKNSSLRTPQTPLPVKAKARLCAQASHEPLAKQELIKLDSPTVHRVGVMLFL